MRITGKATLCSSTMVSGCICQNIHNYYGSRIRSLCEPLKVFPNKDSTTTIRDFVHKNVNGSTKRKRSLPDTAATKAPQFDTDDNDSTNSFVSFTGVNHQNLLDITVDDNTDYKMVQLQIQSHLRI